MDQNDKQRLPDVIYANLIAVNVTNDDVALEFWEHRVGYATPPKTTEEVAKTKLPIARIVVPFTSAKWLKDYLDQTISTIEENRKAGK